MSNPHLNGKNILFVAHFFPPCDSTEVPGAMRTIKFIRNLNGGNYHVLTTPAKIEANRSALRHISLPVNGERIHRVKPWDLFIALLSLRSFLKGLVSRKKQSAFSPQNQPVVTAFKGADNANEQPGTIQRLKDFVYNLCYFPDQAGPWIIPAFFHARKLVHTQKIDAIFATGSPWSGLFVGYLTSKATGIPLIVDFRDPWMNNPFHQSKGDLLDRWSIKMERAIVQQAAAVSLNTEPLMEEFLERYPEIPCERFFVMPNGFDLSDMNGLSDSTPNSDDEYITFCHAGFLYGVRDPAVLLDAIRKANSLIGAGGRRLRFRQIGQVELAYDINVRYADMLSDGSLILDAARPYQACLNELIRADWVVNVQPATRSQIPSKLYDYLAINKPILNITPKDGALGKIVTKYNLGMLFDFDEADELAHALVAMATDSSNAQPFDGYPARNNFNSAAIADILAQRISSLIGP